MTDWSQAATVLLGTWPSQVASWGREGLAAYIAELEARGLTPEQAIAAIRSTDAEFPPAAGRLTATAVHDPGKPTFAECFRLIFGPGGVLRARPAYTGWNTEQDRDRAAIDRAAEFHPLIGAFIRSQGLTRLRMLHVDDPDHGELVRKQLGQEWEQFCEANADRDVAALTAPRGSGRLGRFDPLSILGLQPHSAVTRPAPRPPLALATAPDLSTAPPPSREQFVQPSPTLTEH